MNYFFKIILIFLFFYFIYLLITSFQYTIENFEDKFDNFEKYDEIYDNEFIDFYEIIYRDFSDINHDNAIVFSKCFPSNQHLNDNFNIMVAGCGVGKLPSKLKEKFKNVIGVDVSENMLKKAQYIYPNVKFIRGNLVKSKIFDNNTFTHIYFDERTLNYNSIDDMKNIISNCFKWLKEEGYLIVPIYDPDELQLASRYYSSKYIDDKGNVHGFTYLNDFSHDCYYIKDDNNKNIYDYYDKIILDDGKKRIKKTSFYFPSKDVIYDIILSNGFDVVYIEKIRIQIVGGYEFVIFKKKKTISTVEDIEKNKI